MRFTIEEVREIIQGKVNFRKCPCCDNNGQEWWDGATGTGVGPSAPANCAEDDICHDDCQACHGLAYIAISYDGSFHP